MADKLNILAMCGSLRKASFNRALMNASISLAPEGLSIKEGPSWLMPIYNADDQNSKGFPPESDALAAAIRAADGILIVSPEYNWSIPAGLKNAIDWLSRYKEVPFTGKPVAIQSAAGGLLGGSRMQYHLRMSLTPLDAYLLGRPEVIVSFAAQKIKDGKLEDQATIDMVKAQLAAFEKFVRKITGK
jgi:chromate reductase, NAD(P)H dehydrogenase (quinone)